MSFIVNQILPFISLLDIDRIVDIFWWLLLLIDCVVYSAVSYIYSIFQIIAHLNFSVISSWVQPLVNRVEALIMVLILFKLGMSFIQYMVNPESFSDKNKGGTSLLINIVICAILLITYQFLFTLFNELSMLIIGYSDGYEFTVLKEIADVTSEDGSDESGLLGRFIFGDEFDSSKFGDQLAGITLFSFLKDRTVYDAAGNIVHNSRIATNTLGKILNKSDFFYVTNLSSSIYREYGEGDLAKYGSVEYRYPLLSTAVGIYLAYVLVILTIEVAIRMFKLIILEVTAPIAIITTIQDGLNASVFKKFYTQYFSVYVSLFIRVLVVYLTSALINMFSQNIDSLDTGSGITSTFVFVIIIVSLFTFAKKLPSFIDSLFGTQTDTGDGKAGFKGLMKSMGGALGLGIGAVGGAIAGGIAGGGVGGALSGLVGGGFRGATGGFRANGVSDFFKNQSAGLSTTTSNALRTKGNGGFFKDRALRFGAATGINDIHNASVDKKIQEDDAAYELAQKEKDKEIEDGNNEVEKLEERMKTEESTFKDVDGSAIAFGNDENDFARRVADSDTLVRAAEADLAHLKTERNVNANTLLTAETKVRKERLRAENDARTKFQEKTKNIGLDSARGKVKTAKEAKENNTKIHEKNAEIYKKKQWSSDGKSKLSSKYKNEAINNATNGNNQSAQNNQIQNYQ